MVVKSKLKKKPVKTIRQKQNQKQIQNVNQIVRIYLDERKKSKRKKTAPQKNLKGVGSSNIIMSSYFPSQNPLSNMNPLQQPYNPHFYPRNPIQQPQAVSTRQSPAVVRENVIPNPAPPPTQRVIPPAPPSSPVARRQPVIPLSVNPTATSSTTASQYTPPSSPTNSIISSLTDPTYQTLIPPNINVPTNPLVAPRQPVNNFPNLQNDNIDDILPFMDETNDEVRIADYNDKDIGNIGIIKPSTTFRTGTADQDTIRIPGTDPLPTNVGLNQGRPLQARLPFYGIDPVEDQIAMDFNMGLNYSSIEDPAQIPLLPSMEAEDRGAEERLSQDDLAIINRYDALRGETRGRRPQTIDGYKKAIERMVKSKRNDEIPIMEGRTRGETTTLTTTPFKTGISERERTPIGKSPARRKQTAVGQATKIGRTINLSSK